MMPTEEVDGISHRFDARSFRDPDGRVLIDGNRVLRLVNTDRAQHLDEVLACASVRKHIEAGRIIGTRRVDRPSLPQALRESSSVVYEHDVVPFVSYGHEWPPSMLAAAASFTIELAQDLLNDDLILKDATPANVLFRGCQPVLVDILSIVRKVPGSYLWLAANQFETTFVLPLLMNMHRGIPLAWSLQDSFSGISHAQAARLIGTPRWLKPDLLTTVALPAALSRRDIRSGASSRTHANDAAARFILARTLSRYQRKIGRIRRAQEGTSSWSRYTETRTHYTPEQIAHKRRFVISTLEELRPDWTLDIGANTGEFSTLAARHSHVVALESDEVAASALFRQAHESELSIHPLVCNFARPSPGLGWNNGESRSFLERSTGRFDLILMLAVFHHLRVTAAVPARAIFAAVAELCRGHLIIEHVPSSDDMFQQLARGRHLNYEDCEVPVFEQELSRHFDIEFKSPLGNGRTLYRTRRLR